MIRYMYMCVHCQFNFIQISRICLHSLHAECTEVNVGLIRFAVAPTQVLDNFEEVAAPILNNVCYNHWRASQLVGEFPSDNTESSGGTLAYYHSV